LKVMKKSKRQEIFISRMNLKLNDKIEE